MAIRYRNPVPGGTIGRTDQGVDISGTPGTPVYAITNETLVGIIQNWYQGQPFYWFKEKGTNIYNYVAEQFSSNLQVGQSVSAGQQIGSIASSGTGLELGFATKSGQTEAMATTGYTEGQATPAGQAYRSQVINRGTGTNAAPGSTSSLAQLWISNGGPANVANIMAAIAMAESGGNTNAVDHDANGSTDYGIWQINSVHGFDPNRLLSDPNYNARAAVSVYKSSGLGAWSTYTSGAYTQFLAGAASAVPTFGQGGGYTRPGGSSGGGTDASTLAPFTAAYTSLLSTDRQAPRTDFTGFSIGGGIMQGLGWFMNGFLPGVGTLFDMKGVNPVKGIVDSGDAVADVAAEGVKILEEIPWYFLRFTEFITGTLLIGVGFYMAMTSRPQRRSVIREAVAASPIGRARRIAGAKRAGNREGQQEHYRLEARRASRAREAARTQKAGQNARQKRLG